ncbi:hypothetical protein WA158_005029 [Blastocystis sp. Blastoise]
MKFLLFFLIALAVAYEPNWESLDKRPLPQWYDDAKLGIFVHWGVFSVPSYLSEWYWEHLDSLHQEKYVEFHERVYGKNFKYQDFANMFKAEMYEPERWAEVFQKSGAQYVVLTTKHHEGFTMWPSKYSWNWNAKDVGPHRDLVGELANAVRKYNMTFGTYYSLFEWYNPLYMEDRANNFTTNTFIETHLMPQMKELINTYKPEVIWVDGDWETNCTYWQAEQFLAWLYNESPVKDTIVTNDRWGVGTAQTHGDFYSGPDRYEPGHLLPHKWEDAMTIQKDSWGYARNEDYLNNGYYSLHELLHTLVSTVAFGGNMLLNVGPTADGRIMPLMQERLIQLGDWMKVNGEAIYKTVPWRLQNQTSLVYYTQRKDLDAVYAILTEWPEDNTVNLKNVTLTQHSSVYLMGYKKPLVTKMLDNQVHIYLPILNVRQVPCQEMYVLKMTDIE